MTGMREPKYEIELSIAERKAMITALLEKRNEFTAKQIPVDEINAALKKLLQAKTIRVTEVNDRDER